LNEISSYLCYRVTAPITLPTIHTHGLAREGFSDVFSAKKGCPVVVPVTGVPTEPRFRHYFVANSVSNTAPSVACLGGARRMPSGPLLLRDPVMGTGM